MSQKLKNTFFMVMAFLAFDTAVQKNAFAADNVVPKVIRLGWVGNKYDKPFTSGIVGYGQQTKAWENEFAKDGIVIQWNFFKGTGPAINEAFANGLLDFASSGDLPATAGKANGLKTRVLVGQGYADTKRFILVAANSTIYKPTDLIGKRITFQKGTYAHLMWDRYARDVLHKDGERPALLPAFQSHLNNCLVLPPASEYQT